MYQFALNSRKINKAFTHFSYAMALRNHKLYDAAIDQFKHAIEWKPNQPRYCFEYAVTVRDKGSNFYLESIQLFHKTIDVCDPYYNTRILSVCKKYIDRMENCLRLNP